MLDASRMFAPAAAARPGPRALGLEPGEYLLVTVHRAAATTRRRRSPRSSRC